MKKIVFSLSALLLLVGCNSSKNEKNVVIEDIEIDTTGAAYICEKKEFNEEYNFNFLGKYIIYLDNENVTNINSYEIIEANNQEILNYYESYFTNNYEKLKAYSGVEYNIQLENNKIFSTTSIDYSLFNLESYAIDYPNITEYLNDEYKLTKDNLINHYKDLSITCEKK